MFTSGNKPNLFLTLVDGGGGGVKDACIVPPRHMGYHHVIVVALPPPSKSDYFPCFSVFLCLCFVFVFVFGFCFVLFVLFCFVLSAHFIVRWETFFFACQLKMKVPSLSQDMNFVIDVVPGIEPSQPTWLSPILQARGSKDIIHLYKVQIKILWRKS